MYQISLKDLALKSELPFEDLSKNILIESIHDDSRKVTEGCLFVVKKGLITSGELFIEEAISRGAVAIAGPRSIVEKYSFPKVYFDSPAKDLAKIVDIYFRSPSTKLKLIGVTGTNGKTTVASFIRQILELNNYSCGEIGTLGINYLLVKKNTYSTTPSIIEVNHSLAKMVELNIKACVIECSSHGLDQDRLLGLNFAGVIFTNITSDHLDYHHSSLNYLISKQKLFRNIASENSFAVINMDDPSGWRMAASCRSNKIVTIRINSNQSEISGKYVNEDVKSSLCDIFSKWGKKTIRLPFFGDHNLSNILCSFAAVSELGLTLDQIVSVIPYIKLPGGRLQLVSLSKKNIDLSNPFVFIDYAHTDIALKSALLSLINIKPKKSKLRVVFGCGGNRDSEKRSRMGFVASNFADFIYLTNDNPRNENPEQIINQICEGIPKSFNKFISIDMDRKSSITKAIAESLPNDFVLIAGKGHEEYQEILGCKYPFSDLEVAVESFKSINKKKSKFK